MSDLAFETVRTARTPIEAELLISTLRCEGLHPLDLNISGHFSFAGADVSYAVQVPSTEAQLAKDVLDSLATAPSNSQEPI